jgi:protein-disulfide isomerase
VKALPHSRHRFALVLCASFAIAGILATANQISAGAAPEKKTSGAAPSIGRERPAASATRSIFAGIPQQGAVLGSPMARVTLVQYADLQCPYCGQWARAFDPEIRRAAAAAEAAGVSGTPAFEVGPTGGQHQMVQLTTLAPEGLAPAIEAVLTQ